MTREPKTLQDWLTAVPVKAVAETRQEDGRTVLLRPKFTSPRLAWLQRLLARPHFRVHLDDQGACLWGHLDGRRSVAELAELQRVAFGAKAEPAEERAAAFVRQLVQGGFVRLA